MGSDDVGGKRVEESLLASLILLLNGSVDFLWVETLWKCVIVVIGGLDFELPFLSYFTFYLD
jgi:hypothetical protein